MISDDISVLTRYDAGTTFGHGGVLMAHPKPFLALLSENQPTPKSMQNNA
jgi:hypothetical protein